MTARVVDYVGEWHSHPQGFSAKASNEDDNLIKKLHQKMRVEGLPAVMLIVAENDINIVVRIKFSSSALQRYLQFYIINWPKIRHSYGFTLV
ncbi:Mov34/MPN/PAD-1 family protein [Klebsiella pneumoniae subsp. pneumoniae]|nr:Mov34/MPN/PAD-1 family protein [Klebsiella pneumoniae subsp. pneumoniae]